MGNNKNILQYVVLLVFVSTSYCDVRPPSIDPSILNQAMNLGDCQACKLFVDSFKKGLERTARGKYEGGDAAWEEEKHKTPYARSEVRLIDIMDGICKEEAKHSVQCHQMAERAEELIENWWSLHQAMLPDLHKYVCIEELKYCCPEHHYGKDCIPCPGDHSNLCNGNGKCRGDGTRKGNGTCLCDDGYTGDNCNQCSLGYYLSYKNERNMLCSKCHVSCMGGCRMGTNKDCVACATGYTFDSEKGCIDVNECDIVNICKRHQFCLNSIGSYMCMACDKSCDGCHGDSPDMCRKCAKGYSKKGEFCVSDAGDAGDDYAEKLTTTRYITYVGLLIATGILLPKSTHLGSLVGIMVLSYIIGAEYYCMINGHTGLVNLKDFDLMQLFHT